MEWGVALPHMTFPELKRLFRVGHSFSTSAYLGMWCTRIAET
jgi:hypothetical protein